MCGVCGGSFLASSLTQHSSVKSVDTLIALPGQAGVVTASGSEVDLQQSVTMTAQSVLTLPHRLYTYTYISPLLPSRHLAIASPLNISTVYQCVQSSAPAPHIYSPFYHHMFQLFKSYSVQLNDCSAIVLHCRDQSSQF